MTTNNEQWFPGRPSDALRYTMQARGGGVAIHGTGSGDIEYSQVTAPEIIAQLREDLDEVQDQGARERIEQQLHEREQAYQQWQNSLTDPEYYAGRAPEAEHEMRADFARAYRLREEAGQVSSLNAYNERIDQADAIENRWTHGDNRELKRAWLGAKGAVEAWQRYPDDMHRRAAELDPRFADTWGRRSFLQAQELTGNGAWLAEQQSDHSNAFAALDSDRDRGGWKR